MSWTEQPTLSGRHVTLRPLVPGDRDALLAATAALRPLFYTFVPQPDTIDTWLQEAWDQRAAGRAMPFAVLDPTGKLVGTTRFMRMSEANRRVEIGATLYDPAVQRTGLNTEAKYLLLGHAFEILQCQCVQIRTDWFNHPSQRAIERLGAKRDGVLRGHRIMPDGYARDMVVYSILVSEWPGVRRNLDHLMRRYGEPE